MKRKINLVIKKNRINDIRHINIFFRNINFSLKKNGIFKGNFQSYSNYRIKTLEKFSYPFNKVYFLFSLFFLRVLPKLWLSKKLYFFITKGKGRVLSKAEVFGRLYYCGFEIIDEELINNKIYFTARKIKNPLKNEKPTTGFIIKLRRIGKNKKPITVYKFRSMSIYSEYLQEYIFNKNNLQDGGKIKNDFRISFYGRFIRKYWIDELPMLLNLLKGDIKLVGVRPISFHYFSLYDKELQNLRVKTKPGLLPPFYADLPKTIDEIILSEKRYLNSYLSSPFMTDFKYLLLILKNILLKGLRSK